MSAFDMQLHATSTQSRVHCSFPDYKDFRLQKAILARRNGKQTSTLLYTCKICRFAEATPERVSVRPVSNLNNLNDLRRCDSEQRWLFYRIVSK